MDMEDDMQCQWCDYNLNGHNSATCVALCGYCEHVFYTHPYNYASSYMPAAEIQDVVAKSLMMRVIRDVRGLSCA